MFEAGRIWAPLKQEFAQEMVEECAAFPYGDHDDLVDSMTQAVMRFRQGGFITLDDDYKDKIKRVKKNINILMYWTPHELKEKGLKLTYEDRTN